MYRGIQLIPVDLRQQNHNRGCHDGDDEAHAFSKGHEREGGRHLRRSTADDRERGHFRNHDGLLAGRRLTLQRTFEV